MKLCIKLQIKATHIHEKSKKCLTLSEIFTFYVVYGTLRLLQKAGKVAKVGNFGSTRSRDRIQTSGARD